MKNKIIPVFSSASMRQRIRSQAEKAARPRTEPVTVNPIQAGLWLSCRRK